MNGKLDPETLAVRLRPDEPRVDQANLAEPLELAQADGEQFPRLEVADDPLRRWRKVPRATFAPVDGGLLGDSLGDVDAARRPR